MDPKRLIEMANQIAAFYASEPDPVAASAGVADHIARFWEPRMRRILLEQAGAGNEAIDPLVDRALREHRQRLAGLSRI
jgi:formate dehydrogenase subunit delta